MTLFYHEQQHLQHCLKHALNNLLQREAFSVQQLNELTDSIGAKRTWILGNYDANVLAAALSLQNMEVRWHDARDSELSSLNLQYVHQHALQVVGCSRANTGSQSYNQAVTQAPAIGQQESAETQQEAEGQAEKDPRHLQQLGRCSGLQQLQQQQQQEVTDSSSTQLPSECTTEQQQQQQQQSLHHLQQQQDITDSSSSTQLQRTTSTQELLQQQQQQSLHELQQRQELQHSQQQQPQQHDNSSQQLQPQQEALLVGLVVNVAGRGWWSAITGGRHWIAIKHIDGQWWNLDSHLSAPEAFSPEPASNSAASADDGGTEQLTHYLQQQLAEGAHIMAIYQP